MEDKRMSPLDNDLYKFTMQQAVLHHYPDAIVKYKFKCRNPEVFNRLDDLTRFHKWIVSGIENLCGSRFDFAELAYLKSIPFIKSDYVAFLEDFTFKERYFNIKFKDDGLDLTIEGPWVQTILFEVPVLAIISEAYSCSCFPYPQTKTLVALEKMLEELDSIYHMEFNFKDFGTRRRFTRLHQEMLIESLLNSKHGSKLTGTSNVLFAKKYGLKPIGTMAHEWLQAHQALYRVSDSQKMALEVWAKEYRGDLGIALSDVVGFDAFLRDFDKYFAKLFDGCRHDSGDPYEWANKLIKHYKSLGIDPQTKHAVFSDGLTFKDAEMLLLEFGGDINVSFGIGTYFTNNIPGFTAPQIVIKMVECNGKPVAKISDSSGKGMCEDEEYLKYLRRVFKIFRIK